MIPRKELKSLLQRHLKGMVPQEKLDKLGEEILSLEDGWEEMTVSHRDMGYSVSVSCSEICWLADQVDHGAVIKLFRKKSAKSS